MGRVILFMSLSLDGFIAGPNVGIENPMGDGGGRLHNWMFVGKTSQEIRSFEEESFKDTGAIIMGKRTFDVGVGPWGENPTFHAPCFVLSTIAHPQILKAGGTTFTFVTDGIESALALARTVAGEKDVIVMGGANTAQQYIKARLVDEMQFHLVPVLLCEGVQLFEHIGGEKIELENVETIDAPDVIHLKFSVVKS